MDTNSETNIVLQILKKIPLLAELSELEHQEIIKNITLNYYPVGYVFFNEGQNGAGMYLIKNGMVKISRKDALGVDKEIAVLSNNDFFGEMALVTSEPRNATATAIAECEVFQLKKEDFLKLMQSMPEMANKISNEFIERVKKNSKIS